MFRLTPFENLDSINYEGYYQGLFKHLINGGILRVQDTEDMSIKSYNLEQLRDFVKTNKVYFVDYEICYDEDDECFTLEEVESTDISGSFLNDDFKLSFGVNTFLVSIFDDAVKNEVPYKDGNILNITFNENKFNFSIIDYYWQSNEKDLILLSVNNNPLMFLSNDLITDKFELDFELVQICKTDNGFDIVLRILEPVWYFGIRLTTDLEFVELINVDKIIDKDLTEKTDWKNFKIDIARAKLTGSWGNLVCLE